MPKANFCVECGERLARTGWRARVGGRFCDYCVQRLGTFAAFRPLIVVTLAVIGAFGLGRYLRPEPPPMVIQRAANSPLFNTSSQPGRASASGPEATQSDASKVSTASNDEGYICGARTQKGKPCRRRVHVAGERCFQHKGLTAMVPMEKLVIKPAPTPSK